MGKLRTLAPQVRKLQSTAAPKAPDDYRQWYTFARWRRIRARQLQHEPLCRFCEGQGLTTLATVADHVEPHRGDPTKFWHGSLQSLCANCHSSVKQRLENEQANAPPPRQPHKWSVY